MQQQQQQRWRSDSRVDALSRTFVDEFQTLRETYATPKYPIFLLHGLFGFDTLRKLLRRPRLTRRYRRCSLPCGALLARHQGGIGSQPHQGV